MAPGRSWGGRLRVRASSVVGAKSALLRRAAPTIRPLPCSSSPNRTRSAGLRFGSLSLSVASAAFALVPFANCCLRCLSSAPRASLCSVAPQGHFVAALRLRRAPAHPPAGGRVQREVAARRADGGIVRNDPPDSHSLGSPLCTRGPLEKAGRQKHCISRRNSP